MALDVPVTLHALAPAAIAHVGLLVVDALTDTRTVTVSAAGTLAPSFTYTARIVPAAGASQRAVEASVALTVLCTP